MLVRLFVWMIAFLFLSGCSQKRDYYSFSFSVQNVSNDFGIIILEPDLSGATNKIAPDLPNKSSSIGRFGRLEEFSVKRPADLTIKWQLAILSDCSEIFTSASYPNYIYPGYSNYKRMSECVFTPMSDEIHSKTIDMREIYSSEDGKKAGKVADFFPGNSSHYDLSITLVINNNQLDVRWSIGQTNPWK